MIKFVGHGCNVTIVVPCDPLDEVCITASSAIAANSKTARIAAICGNMGVGYPSDAFAARTTGRIECSTVRNLYSVVSDIGSMQIVCTASSNIINNIHTNKQAVGFAIVVAASRN